MRSFSAEVGGRRYDVYGETSWRNIQKPLTSSCCGAERCQQYFYRHWPICCRIKIKRVDRIGPVTVGHVHREISRFIFYFIQEGDSADEIFSENSPEENPTFLEEDEEKEEKQQAEEDFTIEVESGGEEKSATVIDWYVW